MAGLGSPEWMPLSETQQGSDEQIGAGSPAQTLSSIEPSIFQGLRFSGDLSHPPHIDPSFECHGEPMQKSFFPRDERGVGPIQRIPCDTDREVTAATAQPCTRVHQPRDAAQTGAVKARGRRRIRSLPVMHNEQNSRQIQQLEPHLRSLILFHISNTEALQVFALKRILEYRDRHPPIHICRIERKNDDPRGMILLVICLLCPPGLQAASPFKEPNALPKFAHHFRIVHCDIKNPFTCVVPPCDKTFSLRHDMARHVKAAHLELDGTAEDIEANVPDSVTASNVAGPSTTHCAFNGSSLVVARHNTSSFPSSIPGPNRRVKPYPPQPMATLNQDRGIVRRVMQPDPFRIQPASGGIPITTQSSGTGAGSSNHHRAGYVMSANLPSVGHPSSNRSPMSFHDARGEPYGGLPQIAASGANEIGDYLCTHEQMMRTLSPFLLNGNPGGVPSETHPRIRSRQPESSTVVAQMALPMTFNYPTNATAEDQFAQPRQNRTPSSSVQGPRQLIPTQDTAMALTQQQRWYGSNGTSMSTHHAQTLHHEADYMTIGSAGLEYPFGEPGYMHPDNREISTSSQMPHAGSIQRPQPQHPLQGRVGATINHDQHALYHPQEPPQDFLNMEPWMFTRPPLDPRNLRTSSQTNRARTKPPQHAGANVSLDWKSLKGEVERNLPLWLGLIGLVVGVSEAFLSAILVFLDPPRDRKRRVFSF